LTVEQSSALTRAAEAYGAGLDLCTEPGRLQQLGDLIGECDRIRFLHPALHRGLVAELREKLQVVAGGGETSRARHRSRGKMLARQRVDLPVDPGTAFP